MRTLVVGATGALGRPAVQLLRAQGVAVRALNRHPDQATDLAAQGAEVMAGDLTNPASLQRACAGVERVLAGSGLDAVVLRPTAFMEQHAHLFLGKGVLEKGKAQLIGPGTKPRNFVCAADVARLAVRALLEDPPPFRSLGIGGPGHYSNADVAALYARTAGIAPRASHLPSGLAALLAVLARPLHLGVARVLRLSSLPDDAFSERFEPALDFERDLGVRGCGDDAVRARILGCMGVDTASNASSAACATAAMSRAFWVTSRPGTSTTDRTMPLYVVDGRQGRFPEAQRAMRMLPLPGGLPPDVEARFNLLLGSVGYSGARRECFVASLRAPRCIARSAIRYA
ncbi:MAG: NAD(P)H-binding protein [Caldimonas sp.]